ncbi:MAG: thioredoxin [Conexivisphaerales archaeon]
MEETSGKPVVLSDGDFKSAVQSHPALVVDLWAEWCYPCKMVGPLVEELASEYKGKVHFGKLNVDENPATAEAFDVMAIPTLLVFRDGKLAGRIVGALPKPSLKAKIDQILAGTETKLYPPSP